MGDVQKIIRHYDHIALLPYNNVYFYGETKGITKLNRYPVINVEWLRIPNVIFIWTEEMFEWYDVGLNIKRTLNFPEPFHNCSWNPAQGALAILCETGRVRTVGFDFTNNVWHPFASNFETDCDFDRELIHKFLSQRGMYK